MYKSLSDNCLPSLLSHCHLYIVDVPSLYAPLSSRISYLSSLELEKKDINIEVISSEYCKGTLSDIFTSIALSQLEDEIKDESHSVILRQPLAYYTLGKTKNSLLTLDVISYEPAVVADITHCGKFLPL